MAPRPFSKHLPEGGMCVGEGALVSPGIDIETNAHAARCRKASSRTATAAFTDPRRKHTATRQGNAPAGKWAPPHEVDNRY
jgi:hypothetical protein